MENKEETWYQKGYRPACGFAVAVGSLIGIIGVCVLAFIAVLQKDINALNAIPGLATVIASLLIAPGTVTGIAAWHRGKQQVEQTKVDGIVAEQGVRINIKDPINPIEGVR